MAYLDYLDHIGCGPEAIASSNWNYTVQSESNVATAPDGTVTADRMQKNYDPPNYAVFSTGGTHNDFTVENYFEAIFVYVATISGPTIVRFYCPDIGGIPFYGEDMVFEFDIQARTITDINQCTYLTLTDGGVDSYGNGWYRLWCVFNKTGTIVYGGLDITLMQGFNVDEYYVWGAQVLRGVAEKVEYVSVSGWHSGTSGLTSVHCGVHPITSRRGRKCL